MCIVTVITYVFFPKYAYEDFYLICYNLKHPAYEVIDNIKREIDPKVCYGKIHGILHSHFVKYLQCKGFSNIARKIRKLKPSYLRMPWKTESSSVDCAIFPDEVYGNIQGAHKSWDTQLKAEVNGQYKQILKLQTKYNSAILSTTVNERRNYIVSKASRLFKDVAEQTMMKVATTKVVGVNASNKKTVTFEANLTEKFDESK
ncbi:uncharacterized protein LOC141691034 [Apium graveolens]|uniref:uncharacterized protein LOC141691034 n=1 Tax=Apium graveolens TaxID=4045 RepID=UPI003D7A8C9E